MSSNHSNQIRLTDPRFGTMDLCVNSSDVSVYINKMSPEECQFVDLSVDQCQELVAWLGWAVDRIRTRATRHRRPADAGHSDEAVAFACSLLAQRPNADIQVARTMNRVWCDDRMFTLRRTTDGTASEWHEEPHP